MDWVGNLPQKIIKYEHFLNERLRTDLRKVLDLRDQVYSDIADYNQLKMTVDLLINEGMHKACKPLKTMVDLGCNFYASAKVEDCSKILISIGLGFQLEMELEEASEFVDQKVSLLTEKANRLSEQAADINGRIRVVMETLRELQFSTQHQQMKTTPQRRDLW